MNDYVPEKGDQVEVTFIKKGEVEEVYPDGAFLLHEAKGRRYIPPIEKVEGVTVERLPDPERWEPGDVVRDADERLAERTKDGDWWLTGGFGHVPDDFLTRPLTRYVPETQQPQGEAWDGREVDERLVQLLSEAGDEWGPLGVALAAASLTDQKVLTRELLSNALTTPQPQQPVYRVGDPDPAPQMRRDAGNPHAACNAATRGGCCTLPPKHSHPQHVAGTGREVIAVWPVDGAS